MPTKRQVTRKGTAKATAGIDAGMAKLTGVQVLPEKAILEKRPISAYKYRYTTGPFLVPQNSGSLDWALLNNDVTAQTARVTVFQCSLVAVKAAMPPGALVVTLNPNKSTHNANTYPVGYYYEVQVECNSQLMFPYVSIWPGNFGAVIPGAGINSGAFLQLMP